MTLTNILKDSNYKLTQFTTEQIETLEKNIFLKEVRGKEVPFTNCLVRRKDIQLKPEEAVRQLYLMVLNEQYGYSFDRMEIENVVVPIIDFDKQSKIADLIEQRFTLKKQSEHLLEVAKKAVEIAIEENENSAMKYIKDNT